MRRWLASVDGQPSAHRSTAETVEAAAGITKDALQLIARAAPRPLAESDVVKGLTAMGYDLTDAAAARLVDSLDTLATATDEHLITPTKDKAAGTLFSMSEAVAKRLLRGVTGSR